MTRKILLITSITLYIISSGLSYAFFSQRAGSDSIVRNEVTPKETNDYDALVFDADKEKTEACPLNGALYSKQQKQWWESHRPLGTMIENHQEARPQSGISFADIVYEAVAEGGITRFLAVYYCQDAGIVGPIRSARTYFLDFISEYGSNPLYVHVGGANCNRATGSGCANGAKADALGQIEDYGWRLYNDIADIGAPTFRRDESRLGDVATEHTMYSTTQKLWKVAEERGLTQEDEDGVMWNEEFEEYTFKDDAKADARGTAKNIHLEFWEGQPQYMIDWVYNRQGNTYSRKNGGVAHLDMNTKKQLTVKNLVILYMEESSANDGYDNNAHLLYKTKGKGKASIFMDGKEIKGNWSKATRESKTILTDTAGKEISFNKGMIWFSIMPLEGVVEVE